MWENMLHPRYFFALGNFFLISCKCFTAYTFQKAHFSTSLPRLLQPQALCCFYALGASPQFRFTNSEKKRTARFLDLSFRWRFLNLVYTGAETLFLRLLNSHFFSVLQKWCAIHRRPLWDGDQLDHSYKKFGACRDGPDIRISIKEWILFFSPSTFLP